MKSARREGQAEQEHVSGSVSPKVNRKAKVIAILVPCECPSEIDLAYLVLNLTMPKLNALGT